MKLHSQWCHLCLITTSVWSQIEKEYAASIAGGRDAAEYRAAIDAALNRARQ